jgi:hypothetical protein
MRFIADSVVETDLIKVLPYTGQMCCLHAEGVRELSPLRRTEILRALRRLAQKPKFRRLTQAPYRQLRQLGLVGP